MKSDILSEIEKRTKRSLSDAERAAIGGLVLADSVEVVVLPNDRRARLRMFEKARREARLDEIGLKAKG